ncbi:MAG: TlpA family protein disulfide reductase [Blastocatellia bacterium]|nr:TlpA family protein disulfide reductase [Blastocatellia bacterium]
MKLFLILAAVVTLSIPALSIERDAASGEGDELTPMPTLKLKDLGGKDVDAKKFKAKILVVDFWATWCGPCIKEIPAYNDLQAKYADKGVKLIGVTVASGEAEEVKPFVSRHNMKYAVLMGDDDMAYEFGVRAFPTTFLVTSDWKIYQRYIGAGPAKIRKLESDIEELLGRGGK